MILYHGTNDDNATLDELYFGGPPEQNAGGLVGIWSSLTPAFPMSFAKNVLVLKTERNRILHIPSNVFRQMTADLATSLDEQLPAIHPSVRWRASGYDLVAATEPNGMFSDIIILNPENVSVVDVVPSYDVNRLTDLEIEHWDDAVMAQKSGLVDTLSDSSPMRLAM